MADLESVWTHREEVIYRKLFGDCGQGIYTISRDDLGSNAADPRWGFLGVFESPPNENRSTWLYVTSGLSNPWDDEPEDYSNLEWSGLGVEFVMETPTQWKWAIKLLHRMIAYEISLAINGKPLLAPGGRVGGGGPFVEGTELTTMLIVPPDHYPPAFKLDSGRVEFLQFIGITASELEFAKATNSMELLGQLKSNGIYPVTDPNRRSIL